MSSRHWDGMGPGQNTTMWVMMVKSRVWFVTIDVGVVVVVNDSFVD